MFTVLLILTLLSTVDSKSIVEIAITGINGFASFDFAIYSR